LEGISRRAIIWILSSGQRHTKRGGQRKVEKGVGDGLASREKDGLRKIRW